MKQVTEQGHQGDQERVVNLLKKGVDLFPDNEVILRNLNFILLYRFYG